MPAQPASVAVKFAVATIFLGGIGFGVVAALSQPEPKAKTKPTQEVAKAEPTKPAPATVPTIPPTKPEPPKKPDPKPELKKPDPPKKTEPTKPAPVKPEPPKPEPPKTDAVTFQKVKGILQAACANCHGDPQQKAGIDVRTLASITKKKGVVVPGNPEGSDLWGSIEAGTMPPPDAKTKLSATEKKLIKDWIASGAK
jgi:outer membrane biosynthesis protein TonB